MRCFHFSARVALAGLVAFSASDATAQITEFDLEVVASPALDGREFGIIASCLHPGNVAIERRQESDKESDQEPMMAIETIAEAGLAMVSLPDHVNFLEGIVLPRDQDYIGRG